MFCSHNLLTTLPEELCQLHSLEVLLVNHNKLVSLPEQIGELTHLMKLVGIFINYCMFIL